MRVSLCSPNYRGEGRRVYNYFLDGHQYKAKLNFTDASSTLYCKWIQYQSCFKLLNTESHEYKSYYNYRELQNELKLVPGDANKHTNIHTI